MSAIFGDNVCLSDVNAINGILIKLANIPLVLLMLMLLLLIVTRTSKSRKNNITDKFASNIIHAIILLILYGNQKVTSSLFSLIYCVHIDEESYLFIHGETKCYQYWQLIVIIYISLTTVPQCIMFLLGP